MLKVFTQVLTPLRNDRRGVTIVEYALLAGLIAVALATTLTTLRRNISTVFTEVGASLER